MKNLSDIEIVVTPHINQDHIAMVHGPEERTSNPYTFSRKMSILNLKTGEISGNCAMSEIRRIFLSQTGKEKFLQKLASN